jgi:hypothetical protein
LFFTPDFFKILICTYSNGTGGGGVLGVLGVLRIFYKIIQLLGLFRDELWVNKDVIRR